MADERTTRGYHRLQLALSLARLLVGGGFLVAVLGTGAARALTTAAERVVSGTAWHVALVALALGLAHAALTFPLAWVGGYWLPRRYGLLHQSLASWLGDRAKAAALGGGLALLGVEVIYVLLGTTAWWWLAAAAAFFVLYVVIAAIVPVWILPLFYRMAPLADDALRARLLALAERARVPTLGVWVADESRKSRTANAAVVGLGRTRRILLWDTLITKFSAEEIESVLAHELAHHVHGDMRRGLLAQGLLTLASFAVADLLLERGVAFWGLRGVADPAGVPWLALVLGTLGLVMVPLGNTFSRRLERQADDFALALTRDPAAFIAAMERLADLNLAERRPHWLKEIALHSHPSLDRRIARARAVALRPRAESHA